MAISNILPDPSVKWGEIGSIPGEYGPGFASYKLGSVEPLTQSKLNSGKLGSSSSSFHKWTLSITYNALAEGEFRPLEGFLLHHATIIKPFEVIVPEFAAQTHSTETLTSTSIKGDSIITMTINATPLSPGMIFKVGVDAKVYMISRVETATESLNDEVSVGSVRVHFTPGLRVTPPASSLILFAGVRFTMQSLSDTVKYSLSDKNLYSTSLKLEEVIV